MQEYRSCQSPKGPKKRLIPLDKIALMLIALVWTGNQAKNGRPTPKIKCLPNPGK